MPYMATPVPAVFIGHLAYPYGAADDPRNQDVGYEKLKEFRAAQMARLTIPGVDWDTHQYGGVGCQHVRLFGVWIECPPPLLRFDVDSCQMSPPDIEQVKWYDQQVRAAGLVLTGSGYRYLGEAFYPGIDPVQLWAMAQFHRCRLFLGGQQYKEFPAIDEVARRISAGWTQVTESTLSFPPTRTGAIIFQNCD